MSFDQKVIDRFYTHTKQEGNCLIWTGAKIGPYGEFKVGTKTYTAHRFALIALTGTDPKDYDAGHTCLTKLCVLHVEWQPWNVNRGQAGRNQELCKMGHPLSGDNIYRYGKLRVCKICKRAAVSRYQSSIGITRYT